MDPKEYYSRKDVARRIVEFAANREVACSLPDGSFLKRPDALVYPGDLIQRVESGVISFHCSVELWKDPLRLKSEMKAEELDDLRIGWDLLIDIDAKFSLEHSKIAASTVLEFLSDFGIKAGVKFSGRRGFHIFVPFSCFPESVDLRPTASLYPELPRAIVEFVKSRVDKEILERLASFEGGYASLSRAIGGFEKFSAFEAVEIESNWGSRHLFRAPYTIHHKTLLVSVPVRDPLSFDPEEARPENADLSLEFSGSGDASTLVDEASAFLPKKKPKTEVRHTPGVKVPESAFPPCIKNILSGLSDGRKRSIFTLVTFLRSSGWSAREIESALEGWNSRNRPPLRENTIRTQLKWHLRQSRKLLPPGCSNDLFIGSLGICKPDDVCRGIKNPVQYPAKILKRGRRKK